MHTVKTKKVVCTRNLFNMWFILQRWMKNIILACRTVFSYSQSRPKTTCHKFLLNSIAHTHTLTLTHTHTHIHTHTHTHTHNVYTAIHSYSQTSVRGKTHRNVTHTFTELNRFVTYQSILWIFTNFRHLQLHKLQYHQLQPCTIYLLRTTRKPTHICTNQTHKHAHTHSHYVWQHEPFSCSKFCN